MTQSQEPAAVPAPHSQWKYTGETEGTVMLRGVPLANVTPGQTVEAGDEVQAERLAESGHFEQVTGPEVKAPTALPVADPVVMNAPPEPASLPAFSFPAPDPQPSQPAPGGTE